jgi:hypothetical protein
MPQAAKFLNVFIAYMFLLQGMPEHIGIKLRIVA